MHTELPKETAPANPSQVDSVVMLVQSAGFLKSVQSFSCSHSHSSEYDAREQVVLKFVLPSFDSAHIHLVFWGDGAIELWVNPNCQSPWRMECILSAMHPAPSGDIEKTIEDSVNAIAKTLNLYSTSIPMTDYRSLVEAWKPFNPKLLDSSSASQPPDSTNGIPTGSFLDALWRRISSLVDPK